MGGSSFHNAGPTAGEIIRLIAPILNVEYNVDKDVKDVKKDISKNNLIEENSL
jgi:hypothetical protein